MPLPARRSPIQRRLIGGLSSCGSFRRRENRLGSPRDRRKKKLLLEALEPRAMLSASAGAADIVCHPNLSYFAGSAFNTYSPAQIRHAYGFDQVAWNGAGQTIAIVDAYDDPTVSTDLQKFDRQFGLADSKLTVAKMTSGGRGPTANSGWAMEIALDVEWAHAIAPGANILLVEAVSASLNDLLSAVNYARNQTGVSVVSMSWGAGEFSSETSYDSYLHDACGPRRRDVRRLVGRQRRPGKLAVDLDERAVGRRHDALARRRWLWKRKRMERQRRRV